MIFNDSDTIVAPATPTGGALCIIRMSGEDAIAVCDKVFRGRKPLAEVATATVLYGDIVDGEEVVDDVLVSIFRAPRSYTSENSVEISAHGSRYVVERILSLLTSHGARLAEAGEFTRRAFLAGRMDLSQAEAVADIIAADSQASHAIASTQMRGAYSAELAELRDKLLNITSLLELELDFSEEDVEFADRTTLRNTLDDIGSQIEQLTSSFALGKALKDGVNVAIVGKPNVGKSTLLNALIEEDRAMVSDIAGTTRDTIEATTVINGVRYRFVDTAGIHTTADTLEQMGIDRTHRAIANASIVIHLTTADNPSFDAVVHSDTQHHIRVANKIDTTPAPTTLEPDTLCISAKSGIGIDALRKRLAATIDTSKLGTGSVVVSNMRHYAALREAYAALISARTAMDNGLPSDLLSEDIRRVVHHLGEITGEITSDDILHSIFSHFCIGK